MPTFAAIDLGLELVRLKIADGAAAHLKTLHEDREVVRLGESVFQTGDDFAGGDGEHDSRR